MTNSRPPSGGPGRRPFVALLAEELPSVTSTETHGRSGLSAGERGVPPMGETRKTAVGRETTDDD